MGGRRHVRPATELPTNHGTVPRSVRHGHEGPSRHGFGYQRCPCLSPSRCCEPLSMLRCVPHFSHLILLARGPAHITCRLQLVVFAASHTAVRTVVFLVIERSTAR